MKWCSYLILFLVIARLLANYLMQFRNKVVNQKEDIEKAKSRVRILKAKYLQVLRESWDNAERCQRCSLRRVLHGK